MGETEDGTEVTTITSASSPHNPGLLLINNNNKRMGEDLDYEEWKGKCSQVPFCYLRSPVLRLPLITGHSLQSCPTYGRRPPEMSETRRRRPEATEVNGIL